MSDPKTLEQEIQIHMAAALASGERQLLMVSTFDAPSVHHRLTQLVSSGAIEVEAFQVGTAEGLSGVDPVDHTWMRGNGRPTPPSETLHRLARAPERPSLFALYGFEPVLHQPEVQSALWHLQCGGTLAPHVVVLVDSPSAFDRLPEALRGAWVRFDDAIPSRDDHHHYLARRLPGQLPEETSQGMAAALTGFTATAAHASLQRALPLRGDRTDWAPVIDELHQGKRDLLRSQLQMELLPPPRTPVVGLDLLLGWLDETRDSICSAGTDRGRGILLVGPPGTGKSLVSSHIGQQIGHPVVDFRIVSLMDSLVGATENNFLHATRTLDALAPAVVFIDEIEKAISGGSSTKHNDGGTMARSHGVLLTWLNDSVAPVYVVGTANQLHLMDDWRTVTRKGRFDETFFVDVPGPATRDGILRQGLPGQEPAFYQRATGGTRGFSGADLAHVARMARLRADTLGRPVADLAHEEIAQMRPAVDHALLEFEELRAFSRQFRPASSDTVDV